MADIASVAAGYQAQVTGYNNQAVAALGSGNTAQGQAAAIRSNDASAALNLVNGIATAEQASKKGQKGLLDNATRQFA
jgi:hypothetical protein